VYNTNKIVFTTKGNTTAKTKDVQKDIRVEQKPKESPKSKHKAVVRLDWDEKRNQGLP
jgi:DNA replication protein DnaD